MRHLTSTNMPLADFERQVREQINRSMVVTTAPTAAGMELGTIVLADGILYFKGSATTVTVLNPETGTGQLLRLDGTGTITGDRTVDATWTFSEAPLFSTMTAGSVLFAGASGIVSQDNANLFWDDSGNNLRLGAASTGTNAAKVFAIGIGTAPTTRPANMIQMWAADYAAGDTRYYLLTESGADPIILGNGSGEFPLHLFAGPNSLFNGEDPYDSGHNHNLINPDFWFDYHHRRLFLRSIFFGEINDPVDIGIRRATGTYPDTLGASALGSGDTIGHIKWYPWNGTSYQGASAMIYVQTAEVPTSTDTGGNLYFGTCPINGDNLGSTNRKWMRLMHHGVLEMYTRTATDGSATPYRMLAVTSGGINEFGDSSRVTSLVGTRVYLIGDASATPTDGTLSAQKGVGTNIAGADLLLLGGAQTGNALPGAVWLKAAQYVSETSGTTERTPITRYVTGLSKVTADAVSTNLFSVPLGSPEMVAFRVKYAVHARSGGNTQVETGYVDFLGVNLGGVFTMGTPTPVMSQALSAGTLSVTFAISAANPAVVSVTVDTSLTPTSGWPRINYSIENFSPTEVTIS